MGKLFLSEHNFIPVRITKKSASSAVRVIAEESDEPVLSAEEMERLYLDAWMRTYTNPKVREAMTKTIVHVAIDDKVSMKMSYLDLRNLVNRLQNDMQIIELQLVR